MVSPATPRVLKQSFQGHIACSQCLLALLPKVFFPNEIKVIVVIFLLEKAKGDGEQKGLACGMLHTGCAV